MTRFRPGDKVYLVRPDPTEGRLCIPEERFNTGKILIVEQVGVSWITLNNGYSVNDCMLDPAAPLSPFDQAVNDYIRMELQP